MVFFLTETKIDATCPMAQVKIDGYDIYCNDLTKGGGGVMAFISTKTPSKKLALRQKLLPLLLEAKFGNYEAVMVVFYRLARGRMLKTTSAPCLTSQAIH